MFDLNNTWIEFNCPRCTYLNSVQLVDVKSERSVFCPNCKSIIELKDDSGSVHSSVQSINNAFNDLARTLKNFGK